MTRTGTTEIDLLAEAVDGALAALDAVGINAQVRLTAPGDAGESSQADAVLEVFVDDRSLNMSVEAVSYCTAQNAARLLSRGDPAAGTFPLLVADRITAEARTILTDAGWSWLDPVADSTSVGRAYASISRYRRANAPRPPSPAPLSRVGREILEGWSAGHEIWL